MKSSRNCLRSREFSRQAQHSLTKLSDGERAPDGFRRPVPKGRRPGTRSGTCNKTCAGEGFGRAIPYMTPLDKRYQNDIHGLRWISDFCWLRPTELGALIFDGVHARKQAERLARSWVHRGLVLERVLPERAGRALVLASRGVQLLADAGIAARSGKDIGKIEDGIWRPQLTWKHDLLATQVLVNLYQRGFDVLPEPVLRRTAGPLAKMPDGLAIGEDRVIWLEVESARKTGPAMRLLADTLSIVAAGQATAVCGHRPTQAMVAYLANAQDERGHALSHRARVQRAVAEAARSDVQLTFAECTRRGVAGVGSLQLIHTTVAADRASAILKRLDASGWRLDEISGVTKAHYGSFMAYVWQDPVAPGTWSYDADGEGWVSSAAGYADSITEAKRCAADLIASR